MVLKQCVVCGKDFNARGNSKTCSKKCSVIRKKQYFKQYYQDNAERFKEYGKQYYQNNTEHIKERMKQYNQDNAEHIKEYRKQYYQDNAERFKEYGKQYRQDNAERLKEYKKQYYRDNAEHIKEYNKQYRQDNAKHIKQYRQDNAERIKQYRRDKLNYYYNELSDIMNIEEDRIRQILPVWFVQRELECIENGSYFLDFICPVNDRASGKCELTGKQSNNLVVHHLNGYNWCIEGRMDINNAVVIDKEVHNAFHNKYGRGNNTKKQWEEFVEDYNKGITTLDDFIGD